jgi:hypothetical protein
LLVAVSWRKKRARCKAAGRLPMTKHVADSTQGAMALWPALKGWFC